MLMCIHKKNPHIFSSKIKLTLTAKIINILHAFFEEIRKATRNTLEASIEYQS